MNINLLHKEKKHLQGTYGLKVKSLLIHGRNCECSFQFCLKCGTQVVELLTAKGWTHNPPRHPRKDAVLLIGHPINRDAPPEVHVVCTNILSLTSSSYKHN